MVLEIERLCMDATPSESDGDEVYEVQVVGFEQVTVCASSRKEAMEKARDSVDFGDLVTDFDEYRVERPGKTDEKRYDVYKNGVLVEENKQMNDQEANKLDGHTQFNEEKKDFEKFRVEEAN